ncbi:MAG TPA: TrmJ/YjtD family RNA methyltransferase [Candidatus Binataceae bacterium]
MDGGDSFAFVLFKPKLAGNAGAAARALKNMGFSDLRLVAPGNLNRRAAAAMAVHAADVLAGASTYPDLGAAVADCTITVGTTCRTGLYRSAAQPLREAAAELVTLVTTNRIAIIFGPEDRGLTNRELKRCHRLITIPTAPDYASLNLAQAVVVVAYELMMAARAANRSAATLELVGAGETHAMLERMAEALVAIGFLPADNPEHIMFAIRGIFGRSGLTARELDILNGMARQIRWAGEGGVETLARKRRAGKKLR